MKTIYLSLLLLLGYALLSAQVCFTIEDNPNTDDVALSGFDRYVNVFGIGIYGEPGVSDEKVLHVAAITAEWLDNNEDGLVDDEIVLAELLAREALMPVFASEGSAAEELMFENYEGEGIGAVCYDFEIVIDRPLTSQFDATLEEVLHTISQVGYANAYPADFAEGPNSGSTLTAAMDLARGGHFLSIPANYPDDAWYHYDDFTCDYNCMATEYFYWGLTSMLGIQDYGNRCAQIDNEWEACTAAEFESMDLALFALFSNPAYDMPSVAPDGNYCPTAISVSQVPSKSISVYPNPSSGSITIASKESVEVFDAIGRLHITIEFISGQKQSLSLDLEPGLYWLKAKGAEVKRVLIL